MRLTKRLLLTGTLLGLSALVIVIQRRAGMYTDPPVPASKVVAPLDLASDTFKSTGQGVVDDPDDVGSVELSSRNEASPPIGLGLETSGQSANTEVSKTKTAELTAEDLDEIVIAAVTQNPVLAANPMLRYTHAVRRSGAGVLYAVAVFEPFERSGVLAESASVPCRRATDDTAWQCSEFFPKQYLTLPNQPDEVPILGALTSDIAVASVDFARALLTERDLGQLKLKIVYADRFNQDPSEGLLLVFAKPNGDQTAVSFYPHVTEMGTVRFEGAKVED